MLKDTSIVFVMCGPACNFACKYCMQRDKVTNLQHVTPSPEFWGFFENLADATVDNRRKTVIQFYGGEPTLYFPFIREFVEQYGRDFNYSTISNGGMLNAEMVEFFNEYSFSVGISNDGPTTEFSRGQDILKDEKIKSLLQRLNHVNFSAVMHAKNYDPLAIAEHVCEAMPDCEPPMVFDTVMDSGGVSPVFTEFDMDMVFTNIKKLFNVVKAKIVSGEKLTHAEKLAFESYARAIAKNVHTYGNTDTFKCGTTNKMVNVDLEGNLYLCHNSDLITGHVTKFAEYINSCAKHAAFDKTCFDCPGWTLCGGGCCLMYVAGTRGYYCQFFMTITPYVEHEVLAISRMLKEAKSNV